jgi:PleD family two-component response regulator
VSERKPVNILLVDDQPQKLLAYEALLEQLGENLIRASSADEALEQLLRNEIAVVLVDVCMPGTDGFELASMVRGHPRFQKTAIILVSGVLVDDVDRLKGYHSGAVDYVSVPIVPEILRAKCRCSPTCSARPRSSSAGTGSSSSASSSVRARSNRRWPRRRPRAARPSAPTG